MTIKNEFIKGSEVLLPPYSPDNSELLFVKAYASWTDVEKSAKRDWELVKAAWPVSVEPELCIRILII